MTSLPSYIDAELWSAFLEMRKSMKVPFTPYAQKLIVKKLMGFHEEGWDANKSLENSIECGYRGVFPVSRINPSDQPIGAFSRFVRPAMNKQEALEQRNRQVADLWAKERNGS